MSKRFLSVILSLTLVVSLFVIPVSADSDEWWEDDTWPEEQLLALGAELPDYNSETQQYEISTPEQLLYLSGTWKTGDSNGDGVPDAPCDGHYVLTADLDMSDLLASIGSTISEAAGTTIEGYMPPIAALDEENEGEKCAFFGFFDGQYHVIRNLCVRRMGDKLSGLFGNIGYDYGTGTVCNLGVLDAEIYGKASCGILAGGIYGDVYNCVLTGTIICNEKTAGGVAGKVKKNENGYLGSVTDCFVDCDINVLGQGNENGVVGGISGANSNGGCVTNCYVLGSIRVEGGGSDTAGGIVGNLKSGQKLDNNIVLLREILNGDDGTNTGLLCGSYSGENGSHIHNNYVWEGTLFEGNVASDHPSTAAYETVTTSDALSKALYTDQLGWDFENVWTWIGSEEEGCPMIRGFESAMSSYDETVEQELVINGQIFRSSEPLCTTSYDGESAVISATVTEPVDSAVIVYGTSKKADELDRRAEMTPVSDLENTLTGSLDDLTIGTYYYYIEASDGSRFPTCGAIRLDVVSAAAKFAPGYLTLSPGSTYDSVGINFTTESDALTAQLKYRPAGGSEWTVVDVTEIEPVTVKGEYAFTSYSVDLSGLEASSEYEYMAVTNDGVKDYNSDICKFTTLTDGKEFSFIVISDLQGTSEEAYKPYLYTTEGFLTEQIRPDFVINLGDLTEDNTTAQWQYMYETIGTVNASTLTAYVPGNHEATGGNLLYTIFKGRTNLPGGISVPEIAETTSSFIVGDVCIVTMNTEPYSGLDGADTEADRAAYYELQKEWAKEVFEASGCSWRIVCAHAGLVQDNEEATAQLEQMCDELDVDLFFNGHIHDYFRATVNSGVKVSEGEGTTFITTSPMGTKFDDYEGEIDDLLQFQTGSSKDERQYFTCVECSEDRLVITAYQRTDDGTASAKNCADYTVIDTFTLTKAAEEPVQETEEPAPATETPASETPAEPAETETVQQTENHAWILIPVIAAVCAAAAVCFFVLKRKKK